MNRLWAASTVLAALVVILSSGWTPWIDGASGAFVPADIAQDVAAARLFRAGVNPYGPVIREMHAQVVPVPVGETFPYFPHPPFSLLISGFSAFVSFETAALVWFSTSIALLFVLAALLAATLHGTLVKSQREHDRAVLVLFGALLCWPPVLYNLEKGQWSIWLAVLIAFGWRALSRGRMRQAGTWIGLAAAVKVFPVLMGGYLYLRSRKSFVAFVLTGAIATGVPLLFIGIEAFPAFVRQAQMNMPVWDTFPSVTLSFHGAVARLLIGGAWAKPLFHAPGLARVVDLVGAAVLLGVAGWVARRAQRGCTSHALAFSVWTLALPVMNPQSLGHNAVLLALPIVLTLPYMLRAGVWQRIAWSAALILVSVPRQTTWRLAPPPVEPWQGLAIVALPMWGAFLLLAVVVSLSRSMAPEASREPAQTLLK